MLDVRKLLAQRPLLFDGGMGTYYKAKPGQECEQANLTDPEGILAVHRAYLAAGADAIKTNTFSLPRLAAAQQQTACLQFRCAGVAHDPSSPFYKKSFLR